jgi:peptidoglycan L-alanyl-D-glutamate endopeptidase CwlK
MARFGASSEAQLNTCDPMLQAVLRRAVMIMDFSVLKGHRGEREQNDAYATGHSTKQYPDSTHNGYPSKGVDIAPYPIDWEDTERFVYLAGVIKAVAWYMGIGIRWGGDWDNDNNLAEETFRDYGHFELKEGIWLPS